MTHRSGTRRLRRMGLHALAAGLLSITACSSGTGDTAPDDADRTAIPTQAQVEAFAAEGPEAMLQRIRPVDYWLLYVVMRSTGLEAALGGEARALAALQAMGNAYERQLRGIQAQPPTLVPVAFTGEGMATGVVGMGMGLVAATMTGGLYVNVVGRASHEELVELAAKGPETRAGTDGHSTTQIGEDGSISHEMEIEVDEGGIKGKVKVKIKMQSCPDASGKVTLTITTDSSMRASGKAGTGGYVRSTFTYDRYLDDDAHLIDGDGGGASDMQIEMGGFENYEGQHVRISIGHSRGGESYFSNRGESGFSLFRPEEAQHTLDLLKSTIKTQTLLAEGMLRNPAGPAPWEGGHCVKLDATSNPSKRKHARPGTTFEIEAKPRARADGAPTGGTVRATLSGNRQLTPATGKIPADARYSYAGPDKKDESASIEFEARSKRGVGRATLEFDTKQGAHRVSGGQNDFQADHTVCALDAPFDIHSSVGLTMHLVPAGDNGGAWTQSGNAGGVSWSGGGNYSLSLDDNGNGTLKASGTSIIATPLGRFSDAVEPEFSITQAEGESCD